MKLRIHARYWLVLGVLAVVALAWLFKPSPHFNREHLDAELPAISEPLRMVRVLWYLDGGSISVELVRTNNETTTCFIPAPLKKQGGYSSVFIGTDLTGRDKGRELAFPEDHRAYLITLIDKYAPRDEMKVQVLVSLRGYPRDYISAYLYGIGQ